MSELSKTYQAKEVEKEIYQLWEKSGCFHAKINTKKKPFTVMIPPPNITGSLHMGHALNNTIQDILVRYHRMKGDVTLWLPGIDHAGIATQNVVEKLLRKEGISKEQLGRDKFVKRVWQWKEKYGEIILEQLKKLGCSCDWKRQRFTLDKNYSQAVKTAFIHYYQKGYLYRGPRIVNWCPRCQTAISDIEVKYQPEKTKLYTFRYGKNFPLAISTTRPETKLGDTAVAVNPKDKRYKKYVGKKYSVNFLGVKLEIKIIADEKVDPQFGTGAVGVTPAHSQIDFELAQKHHLKIINVINEQARMTEKAGPFKNLTVQEARKKIIEELKKKNLLEKVEDYEHSLSLCDRCGTPIEPLISEQWFVKMKDLAKPAIEVVKKGKIKFIPSRYKKIYLEWMKNIKDWCISRQLWWGHQMPVYYCEKCDRKHQKPIVQKEKPKKCPYCGSDKIVQEEDVLDTWFSSALWPFATLGWPQKTKDLAYFYPTSFLSTAPGIIYLWVARMIISGLEFMKKIPFPLVYLHGTVLTKEGKRMSKSLGTGVDPLKMIEKYGADATRFGIIYQAPRDSQAIRFSEEALISSQKFINKIWNIARFITLKEKEGSKKRKRKTLSERWILSRLNRLIEDVNQEIESFHFSRAEHLLYEFIWHNFADWYLEISKTEKNYSLVKSIYLELLKLLHPFIPFVTEEIYQKIKAKGRKDILMTSPWPKVKKNLINKKVEDEFELLKGFITEIRKTAKEKKIKLKEVKTIELEINKKSKLFLLIKKESTIIEGLLKIKLKFSPNIPSPLTKINNLKINFIN